MEEIVDEIKAVYKTIFQVCRMPRKNICFASFKPYLIYSQICEDLWRYY